MSLFKARRVLNDTDAAPIPKEGGKSAVTELTKNQKYCVSRLPALPAALQSTEAYSVLNGYADGTTSHAMVTTSNAIHVWNYNSLDGTPLSIQFPTENSTDGSSDLLPFGIITRPASGTNEDPGIAIISPGTGKVRFYSSVQNAPTIGLVNDKLLEITIPLAVEKGEYITLAENVEPAGIAVATSRKRCILITLRDFKGKPNLGYTDLTLHLGVGFVSNLIRGIFGHRNNNELTDEIVSIKLGRISNNGMTEELVITDSNGGFHLLTYQFSSTDGSPYVDSKQSFQQRMGIALENSLDGFLPGSSVQIKVLDLWPLKRISEPDMYLTLCYLDTPFQSEHQNLLILVTMQINQTGVLVYGTHKLLKYNHSAIFLDTKPRLFLPSPETTAFVLIDNSLILTDIDISYIHSKSTGFYYKPRWEDIISLKADVQVIGQGYENRSDESNSSVILLTGNSGVLRVERFADDNAGNSNSSVSPVEIVKSHLEQAIFYPESSTLDFNLKDSSIELADLSEAIVLVAEEVFASSSVYFPQEMPSISESLQFKSKLLSQLVELVSTHYPEATGYASHKIIDMIEKVDTGYQFWQLAGANGQFKNWLKDVIVENCTVDDEDPVKDFFTKQLSSIDIVFATFIRKLESNQVSEDTISTLLVTSIYEGTYENEKKYSLLRSSLNTNLWTLDTNILFELNKYFTKECNGSALAQNKLKLVHYCQILYYMSTSAIEYLRSTEPHSDKLKKYEEWYETNKSKWIGALIEASLDEDATIIAEAYGDLSSLVQILEAKKEGLIAKFGANSNEVYQFIESLASYFHTYGQPFAFCYFTYCLDNNKIQQIFQGFPSVDEYYDSLEAYFIQNPKETSDIAWIQYLLDNKFARAKASLVEAVALDKTANASKIELSMSLAKLSAIAAGETADSLKSINAQLLLVRTQRKLLEKFIAIVSARELLTPKYFESSLLNSKAKLSAASIKKLEAEFSRLNSGSTLTATELIDLLTLSLKEALVFADAIAVASMATGDQQRKLLQLVWMRLLACANEWRTLDTSLLLKTVALVRDNAVALECLEDIDALCRVEDELAPLLPLNLDALKEQARTWVNSAVEETRQERGRYRTYTE